MYYFIRTATEMDGWTITYKGKTEPLGTWYESHLIDIDGNTEEVVDKLKKECPTIDTIIPLKISGDTYEEQKESLRNLAIDIQAADSGGLSWGEVCDLQDFFEYYGEGYGLLEEFRENAIC